MKKSRTQWAVKYEPDLPTQRTVIPIGAELEDVMPRDDGTNGAPIDEFNTEVIYGNER